MVPSRRRLISVVATVMVVGGALLAPSAQATGTGQGASVQQVANATVAAVVQRLDVMPAVAYTKFRKNLPVDDPAREAQAAEAFVSAAGELGVPRGRAMRVVVAQFDAAKRVQRRLIRQWTAGVRPIPHHPPADLVTDLRPRIDAATGALLTALVARPAPGSGFRRALGRVQSHARLRAALKSADLSVALAPWRPIAAPG